jgi:hypothetical protein
LGRTKVGKVLKPCLCSDYLYVDLCEDGVVTRHAVHDLVASAFLGPKPPGYTVNHKDTDKLNNVAGNLEYKTNQENIQHGFAAGCYPKGETSHLAYLTEGQVRQIKALLAYGEGGKKVAQKEIARRFSTTAANVSAIKRGKSWRHITV